MGQLDPKLPVAEVRSLDAVLSGAVAKSRFTMALLVLLSVLALVIASVGVYGVISYAVSQRRTEIGIRMALGSAPSRVMATVLAQGLWMTSLGVVVGVIAAVAFVDWMGTLLHGVAPRDPMTFVVVPLVLLGAAFLGSVVPALRASRVDPVVALRAE